MREHGMKKLLLKNTLLCGLLTAVASCSGCATPSQAYWDAKVKEMCEKEGGVKVYEKVTLTQEEYKAMNGRNGIIFIPHKQSDKYVRYPYYQDMNITTINNDPSVRKTEITYYRKIDDKVLGTITNFGMRSDGDIGKNGSSLSCEDFGENIYLEKKIFLMDGN